MSWQKYAILYGNGVAVIVLMVSLAGALAIVLRGFRAQKASRDVASISGIAICCLFLFASLQYLRIAPSKLEPLKSIFDNQGRPAPDLVYTSLDTKTTHRLSDLSGNVVVLNIWATWCTACKGELPDLNRLQQMYHDRGLVVLTITDEDFATVSRFAPLATMTVLKGRVQEGSGSGLYVRPDVARPVTHIIDSHGILRQTFIGQQTLQQFENEVTPYLSNSGPRHPQLQ